MQSSTLLSFAQTGIKAAQPVKEGVRTLGVFATFVSDITALVTTELDHEGFQMYDK